MTQCSFVSAMNMIITPTDSYKLVLMINWVLNLAKKEV